MSRPVPIPDLRRLILAAAWLALGLAPPAMVAGHLDAGGLDWTRNFVSTFAARAPHGDWVTAAMLLSAAAMGCIGIAVAAGGETHGRVVGAAVALLMGAAVAGLLLLAANQEVAPGRAAVRALGFAAIRQQSFHDAGLLVFFYGAILALMVAGTGMAVGRLRPARIPGLAVAACGPLSFAAMTTNWLGAVGLPDNAGGLKQRAAFLLLWLGSAVLLAALSRRR